MEACKERLPIIRANTLTLTSNKVSHNFKIEWSSSESTFTEKINLSRRSWPSGEAIRRTSHSPRKSAARHPTHMESRLSF